MLARVLTTVQLILIGLVVTLLSASHLTAQTQTAEAPTYHPGDTWTFEWREDWNGTRTGTSTRTVVRKDTWEGQDVYILSRSDASFSVLNTDSADIATLDGEGKLKVRFGWKGDSQFPISVGKVSTQQYDNPVGQYRGTYRHMATSAQEIRVKAGSFTAFRITEDGQGTFYNGRPFTERGTLYYAPAAKNVIKLEFEVSNGYRYSQELIRYTLQPD